MGNTKVATRKQKETALVTLNGDLALPEDLIPELDDSPSLQEIDGEDRMTPYYCFNVKLQDDEGGWYPKEVFFHTLREDTKPLIDCVLLFLHKTNRYRTYSDETGSETVCQSLDRKSGVWMDTGEERLCKGCEYTVWKNHTPPPCKLCYSFVGMDADDGEPFIITAKSTSLSPARQYLNKNFLRKLQGRDLPLYVYRTHLGLEQPNGTYAVLTFERGPANTPNDIRAFAALTKELLASTRLDFAYEQPEAVEVVSEESEEEKDDLPF